MMDWRRFLHRRRRDREAACEIEFYLDTEIEDNRLEDRGWIASFQGMSRERRSML